ncbi:AraC family ligand binding domain-containing protein [Escherichia coli]|uniref:AraC family ligand binding domain-containing protein n=1 Tax=Escherichia coli TaxID=562 RepID=UPI00388D9CB2
MAEAQNDPLLPGYSFNAHLVAGLTPIEANGYLDFYRPTAGNERLYSQSHHSRSGHSENRGTKFVCRPGDILLFPPGRDSSLRSSSEAHEWYHQWVYFRPRAYWHEWVNWPSIFANTGFFRRMKRTSRISATCLGKSLMPDKGKGAIRNCWR